MRILIDNGHGIDTKGKRSPDFRLLEWKWTREIAVMLEQALKEKNMDVVRIVKEDTDIALRERVRRANTYGIDSLLVSLHVNASGNDGRFHNASGFTSWVSLNSSSKSRAFADMIDKIAQKKGLKGNRFGTGHYVGNFAILRDTVCPAVLTENLFMDNKNDLDYLLSDKGKKEIVDLHVQAILQYIGL